MKKITFLIVFFCLIGGTKKTIAQNPVANGNVMMFSSVANYESFTENENSWVNIRNVAEQSSILTTLAEVASANENVQDTLYPDFLKEVLNTDYIFQIGDYLIKIDAVYERGLVISSKVENGYEALVKDDLKKDGMMVLNGDDDFGLEFLEALENNSITPGNYESFISMNRPCPGARRRKEARIETWAETSEPCDIGNSGTLGRTYGMDNKVVYQKAIFYFSLQSKIRSVWRCTYGGSWTMAPINKYVDLKLVSSVKYRKRCEAEINDKSELFEGYYSGGDGILNWRPYSGGRSLSHYDFHVDFGIRPAQDRVVTPAPYIPSIHYNIMWGY